jgi:hypothetical protein
VFVRDNGVPFFFPVLARCLGRIFVIDTSQSLQSARKVNSWVCNTTPTVPFQLPRSICIYLHEQAVTAPPEQSNLVRLSSNFVPGHLSRLSMFLFSAPATQLRTLLSQSAADPFASDAKW